METQVREQAGERKSGVQDGPSWLQAGALAALAGLAPPPPLPPAWGVSFFSGSVRPGDIFFALPGASTHGIVFADAALATGAAFIVSDRPHPQGLVVPDPAALLLELGKLARDRFAGPVIGITGSAGKTSTKAMVATALEAYSSPGNFNTPYALAKTLIEVALQQESEGEVAKRALVLELGIDHRGEMDTLLDLVRPSHAVLTLVDAAHLSGLGSLENIATEKGKLVRRAQEAFIHISCAHYYADLLARSGRATTYGLEDAATPAIAGRILESSPAKQVLEVLGVRFTLPYPGRSMAENAVAALALAQRLGVPPEDAARRLEAVRLEPGRLEVLALPTVTLINDAYNSNPAAAAQALEVLRQFPRPHTAILGDMLELGEASARFHQELGERAKGIDTLLAVGPQAKFIAQAHGAATHFEDVDALLAFLATQSLEGTVLVKASRGMKLERVVERLKGRA